MVSLDKIVKIENKLNQNKVDHVNQEIQKYEKQQFDLIFHIVCNNNRHFRLASPRALVGFDQKNIGLPAHGP